MNRPTFSVVIPSLGKRMTLYRTLDSILGQTDCAEAIVVADAYEMDPDTLRGLRAVCEGYGARFLAHDAGHHDAGSPQIALGFEHARGTWLLNAGDDDLYVPGAFDAMRRAIDDQADRRPLLFRAELHPAPHRTNAAPVVLWDREGEIREGRVTGQNFCCPNDPDRLGRWVNDWTFIQTTVAAYDGRVDWREEITCRCY